MKVKSVVLSNDGYQDTEDTEKWIGNYVKIGYTLICKTYVPALYKGQTINTYIAILVKEVEG